MPAGPPRPRFTLADLMILVASTAGLLGVIPGLAGFGRMEALPAALNATLSSAALFFGLGGLGACAARWRGRPRFEGFCLGFICGPFGLLMIGLSPRPGDD